MARERGEAGSGADVLRDYWSGHGHAGPSHGAERDAIRWGEPGDFDRCVVQVTEHGKMTPEQAKGYCNLRHHDALGYYPATHAAMEGKGYNPSQQRVSAGNVQGGQFGSQGTPSQRQAAVVAAANVAHPARSKKPTAHQQHVAHQQRQSAQSAARTELAQDAREKKAIRSQIAGLRSQLSQLTRLKATISSKVVSGKPSASTGTRKPVTAAKPATTTAAKPVTTAKPSTAKPGAAKPSAASSAKTQLAQVNADIARVRAQIAGLQQQLAGIKSVGARMLNKAGPRNPRDRGTGQFRTFQGELQEAKQALAEGRMTDVVELLGSARALATTSQERLVLGELQGAMLRTQHVVPDLTKAAGC